MKELEEQIKSEKRVRQQPEKSNRMLGLLNAHLKKCRWQAGAGAALEEV